MAAEQEIKIRVRGEDDGSVSRVMKKIAQEAEQTQKRIAASSSEVHGPIKASRFGGDDQLRRNEQAAQLRQLRAEGSIAERRARATGIVRGARSGMLGDLSAGDLDRESRDRFRATASGGDGKGVESLTDKYAKLAVKAAVVTAVLKGVNAVVELGGALMADSSGNYKKAATGYIAFAESIGKIPIVGQFALNMANKLSGGALEGAKQALADAEEIEKRIAAMAEKRAQRRQRGSEMIADSAKSARDAQGRLAVAGLSGDRLAAAQAGREYSDTIAGLDKRAADVRNDPKLAQDQREEIQKNIAAERLTAQQKYQADLIELERKAADESAAAKRAHKEQMAGIDQEMNQAVLAAQGLHFTAELQAIKDQNAKAKEESKKKYDEEVKALQDRGAKGDDPAWKEAEQRRRERDQGADRAANQKTADAQAEEARERAEQAGESEDRVTDAKVRAASRRLQMAGRTFEAEKLTRDKSLADDLKAIQENYEEQARLHKENEPALRAQAEAEAAAARGEYDADIAGMRDEQQRRNQVTGGGIFSESRLLTGVGAVTNNPLLDPVKDTQNNTKKTADLSSQMHAVLKEIRDKIGGKALTPPAGNL